MAKSMKATAAEINAEIFGDVSPDERALKIANDLRLEFPDSTAAGRQRAAATAAGAEMPPTNAEIDAALDEVRPSSRARKAVGRSRGGARSTRKRISRASRFVGNPVGRVGTVRGLALQSMGLVALYWLLRTPDAVRSATDGVQRATGWMRSTRGIPGA